MDATAPLPKLRRQDPQWLRGSALANAWGLKALAKRLAMLAGSA